MMEGQAHESQELIGAVTRKAKTCVHANSQRRARRPSDLPAEL